MLATIPSNEVVRSHGGPIRHIRCTVLCSSVTELRARGLFDHASGAATSTGVRMFAETVYVRETAATATSATLKIAWA